MHVIMKCHIEIKCLFKDITQARTYKIHLDVSPKYYTRNITNKNILILHSVLILKLNITYNIEVWHTAHCWNKPINVIDEDPSIY
jgi:hypothetical protein